MSGKGKLHVAETTGEMGTKGLSIPYQSNRGKAGQGRAGLTSLPI